MKELQEIRNIIENDDNVELITHNKNNGNNGCAHFHRTDKNIIFVFEGNPDGSDDKEMTIEDFIKNYTFEIEG